MNLPQRNARFWVSGPDGEPVRLTLRPGQSLTWSGGGPNEEGYSWERTTWTHEGDGVRLESETDARDCDGRLSSYVELYCPLDRLAAYQPTTADWIDGEPVFKPCGPRRPDWQRVDSSQRDYAAEAAGY